MLSERLKSVALYINPNDYIVDIGTDHAIIPIYLVKKNLVKGVIAADIKVSALNNAIGNIHRERLEHKIKTVVSDGLENIDLENVDTIVISGMGTKTITKILNNSEKLVGIKKIIVQSNNNYYDLRKNINSLGFFIVDETIIFENNKYYLTICFEKGNKKYKDKDFYWGIIKPGNLMYYESLKANYTEILKKIPYTRITKKIKMFLLLRQLKNIINYCRNYL